MGSSANCGKGELQYPTRTTAGCGGRAWENRGGFPRYYPQPIHLIGGSFSKLSKHPTRKVASLFLQTKEMPMACRELSSIWPFSEIDRTTVLKAHRIFMKKYKEAGVGTAVFEEAGLEQFLLGFSECFNSAAHHIGTTRMATSPNWALLTRTVRYLEPRICM